MDSETLLALRIARMEESLLQRVITLEKRIMTTLTDLQTAIAQENTVIGSAITLINGIAARIAAAGTDQVALNQLIADVQTNANLLAAAVSANQPVDTSSSTSTSARRCPWTIR